MNSSGPPTQIPVSVRMKRYKTSLACTLCRRRKLKCDGIRPACSRCQKKDGLRGTCTYTPVIESGRSPVSHPGAAIVPSPHPPATAGSTLLSAELSDAVETRNIYVDGDSSEFARKVEAAIDARLGLPSEIKRCPIPMIDAPLFGPLCRRQVTDGGLHHVDNVLPPRKHADHLMGLYWRHIDPIEHLLDQDRFSRSYQSLFTGGELDYDERIFVSTLNAVFALSTELQESVPPVQRDEASNGFFQRAWSLLRPETVMWEAGSLEVVQCLLLISRYLQCTKNPHQTWMAVGSAVRIAQSLSLHIPDKPSSGSSGRDGLLRRQVWQCAVFMDRCFSWVLGRVSMAPMAALSPWINSLHSSSDPMDPYGETSVHYSVKMLQLNEITSHVMLSQVPTSSSFAESLGLPRLYQNADLSAAVQIDKCLTKWEESLPPSLQCHTGQDDTEHGINSQRILLRLQLAHARVLLFRPMLAHFCLPESRAGRGLAPATQGLGDRILQDCATICVENSQKMIGVLYENCRPDAAIGILPWWYRVFYLYVASQPLVAAMLRPDVFSPLVLETWSKAMSALCAHEHLSSSVQRCISTFKTMWRKVTEIHCPGDDQAAPPEGFPNVYYQDIFQHLGLEIENPLFGMDNMSLLGNVDWSL